jgi:Flp pilus assembly protein TadD
MRYPSRLLFALTAATLLVGAQTSFGQTPAGANRPQLDSDLARATDVGQLLEVANRYADAGFQQEAKSVVDRAAQKARTTTDWQSISAAYLRLGYSDNANAAQRKARDVPR